MKIRAKLKYVFSIFRELKIELEYEILAFVLGSYVCGHGILSFFWREENVQCIRN